MPAGVPLRQSFSGEGSEDAEQLWKLLEAEAVSELLHALHPDGAPPSDGSRASVQFHTGAPSHFVYSERDARFVADGAAAHTATVPGGTSLLYVRTPLLVLPRSGGQVCGHVVQCGVPHFWHSVAWRCATCSLGMAWPFFTCALLELTCRFGCRWRCAMWRMR